MGRVSSYHLYVYTCTHACVACVYLNTYKYVCVNMFATLIACMHTFLVYACNTVRNGVNTHVHYCNVYIHIKAQR